MSEHRPPESPAERAFVAAVHDGGARALNGVLAEHPELKGELEQPWFPFDCPAIVFAKGNREVVDALLDAGADIDSRSRWWAGSFGVLDGNGEEMVRYLVSRGARVDAHVAAQLGDRPLLESLLDADPDAVRARGGDGKHPLHNAATVEIAELLLERGAEIDARDVDHRSTPAQYLVSGRPEVCRYLVERGATADLFLAAALGDGKLAEEFVASDSERLAQRISAPPFEGGSDDFGGHIYQWTLGFDRSPHEVALDRGHPALFDRLMDLSPPEIQLPVLCRRPDREAATALADRNPGLVDRLTPASKALLAVAAWNNDLEVVRLMLDLGFDPHIRGADASTPLDRAAFHGFDATVQLLLERDPEPPLEWENAYGDTALSCALFGATHTWRDDGDPVATVRALLAAGSRVDPRWLPSGDPELDRLLRAKLASDR